MRTNIIVQGLRYKKLLIFLVLSSAHCAVARSDARCNGRGVWSSAVVLSVVAVIGEVQTIPPPMIRQLPNVERKERDGYRINELQVHWQWTLTCDFDLTWKQEEMLTIINDVLFAIENT